uniref:Uncharacterized protein n=1 Tax=Heterorhabditis bacteriophora TaxID=37862 RepID=A0A1I7W924_HETBA
MTIPRLELVAILIIQHKSTQFFT